jgi:hypothetical protein
MCCYFHLFFMPITLFVICIDLHGGVRGYFLVNFRFWVD